MPLNGIEGIFFVSMTCEVNGIQGIDENFNGIEEIGSFLFSTRRSDSARTAGSNVTTADRWEWNSNPAIADRLGSWRRTNRVKS